MRPPSDWGARNGSRSQSRSLPDLPNLALLIRNSTTCALFLGPTAALLEGLSGCSPLVGRQQIPGPEGEEELHAVPRRSLPSRVALQEGAQRDDEVGPMHPVVVVQYREHAAGERSQDIRILKR